MKNMMHKFYHLMCQTMKENTEKALEKPGIEYLVIVSHPKFHQLEANSWVVNSNG